MTVRGRQILFVVGALGLAVFYFWGFRDLPGFGHYPGPYGDVLNALTVYQRHVTDVITAINFDYRGFDTVGEEFILFTSVMSVLLLLRKQPDDETEPPQDRADDRYPPPTSDAVRVLGLAFIGVLVTFGLYTVTHGQLTPGGGFQGGVILASVPLVIFLCGDYGVFCRVTNHTLTEVTEAAGAGGFVLIGIISFVFGLNYLANFMPLGETGNVASGGTIPLISFTTGIEVAAGFVLLMMAFFDETFVQRKRGEKK